MFLRALVVVVGCALTGCTCGPPILPAPDGGAGGAGGGGGSGAGGGSAGGGAQSCSTAATNHLATPPSCRTTRPPGLAIPDSGFPGSTCGADADCDGGINGRCQLVGNFGGYQCTYDDCFTNTDCAPSGTCLCGAGAAWDRCVASNCGSDSDCSDGCLCSPSYDLTCGPYDGIRGYYCHTPADECTNDSECMDGGVVGYCAFSMDANKWICGHSFCAG
jgi:hypothetical protein